MLWLAIRKRVTLSNVLAASALLFAMGGAAYGAKRYVITSAKQINPKVLKQISKAGPQGAAGPQGPAGASGQPGKDGLPGKDGANGKDGVAGESVSGKVVPTKVATCKEQGGNEYTVAGKTTSICNGQTGFTETLPEGKTEMGTWSVTVPPNNPTTGGPVDLTTISLNIPMASAPSGHFIKSGEGPTTECPGSAIEPQAAEGQLCVYVENSINGPKEMTFPVVYSGGAVMLQAFGGASEVGETGGITYGTWAATGGE